MHAKLFKYKIVQTALPVNRCHPAHNLSDYLHCLPPEKTHTKETVQYSHLNRQLTQLGILSPIGKIPNRG